MMWPAQLEPLYFFATDPVANDIFDLLKRYYEYWSPDPTPDANTTAKKALCNVLDYLNKLAPDYKFLEIRSMGYVGNLFEMKRYLDQGNYVMACSMLCNVIEYYPISAPGIRANVINLLSHYLGE